MIDEAQRVFRPRPAGSKVPDYIQELETHRHKGIAWIDNRNVNNFAIFINDG